MITACHNCVFNELVASFVTFTDKLPKKLRNLHGVQVIANANARTAVETIRRYMANACEHCRRTNQDDIRIKKTPHVKGDMTQTDCDTAETIEAVEIAAQTSKDERSCGTTLPADIEDTLREAMSSFWSLDPIQLLCVQHIMQGKKLSAFGETLRAVHEKIRKYRGSERAQAGMMRDAIAKRIPFIAPIINTHLKADGRVDEHDGVVSLLDEPAGDLFEWGGVDAPFDPLERRTRR